MVDADVQADLKRARREALATHTFGHPLLQLAINAGDATSKHSKFYSLVRRALASASGSQPRLNLILDVLNRLSDLGLEPQSELRFKEEWLGLLCKWNSSPVLSEMQALTLLQSNGLHVPVAAWDGSSATSKIRPLPLLTTSGIGHDTRHKPFRVPHAISDVLIRCIESVVHIDQREGLGSLSADACKATIRIIALLACNESLHPRLGAVFDRADLFESVGLGLWACLAERLEKIDPDPEAAFYRDGSLMRAVSLHLLGSTYLAKMLEYPGANAAGTSQGHVNSINVRVVRGPIAEAFDKQDKEVVRQYEALLNPVPAAQMPPISKLEAVLASLDAEFPWARSAVKELASMLRPRCLFGVQHLQMSPVLLVGTPGSGKTRFVRRMSELLALPFLPISLGGLNDSKPFTGTSRGWASGEPSPLLGSMLRHKTASAVVLLDELDKATDRSSSSSPVQSVLLGLLEPESASRWRDNFLQAECDFSRLCFWGTANQVAGIPKALLSRFTVVLIDSPRDEHKHVLVRGIISDIAREWQLHEALLPTPPRDVYEGVPLNARELRRVVLHFLERWSHKNLQRHKLH